jgi:RHS repeat-associated protein
MIARMYAYDANGNLTQYTDRDGTIDIFSYDALNRLSFAGFGYNGSAGYESTISYTWDPGNRMTQLADSVAGTIARTYDGLDDLTDEQTAQGEVGYLYDSARRRASMTVVGQSPVAYTFDNTNRLTGLTQGTSSVAIGYDNASRRTSLTLPNGVVAGYTYDSDSYVTGITYSLNGSQVGTLNYSYYSDGRATGKTGSLASTGMPSTVSGNTFNADNAMTSFNSGTLSYDANGNLTSDSTNAYTWDARNHLSTISGGSTASFVYDAFGRRVSKSINSSVTQFLYDGWNPIQELNGANPPAVAANLLNGLNIDEFFTRTASGTTSTLLTDALGSSIGLVGSSGTIATTYTYQPFGADTTGGAADSNSYQFTGRENDGTGLYFYRARYYSPASQRFLSQDSVGFGGGDANLYAYVQSDPGDLTDPLGQKGKPPIFVPPPDWGPDPRNPDRMPIYPNPGQPRPPAPPPGQCFPPDCMPNIPHPPMYPDKYKQRCSTN